MIQPFSYSPKYVTKVSDKEEHEMLKNLEQSPVLLVLNPELTGSQVIRLSRISITYLVKQYVTSHRLWL